MSYIRYCHGLAFIIPMHFQIAPNRSTPIPVSHAVAVSRSWSFLNPFKPLGVAGSLRRSHRMASIALPMKGTTLNLLVNPPPSLTCSSGITPVFCTRLNLNLSIRSLSRLLHSTHTITHISKGVGTLFFPNYASGSCTVLATLESDVTVEDEEATHSETTSCDPKPLQGNESAASSVGANEQQMPKRIQRAVGRVAVVPTSQLVPGAIFSGKITAVQKFGAFVEIGAFTVGLVHISQISSTYIKDIHDAVSVGQEVKVKVLKVDEKAGRISLSMRETGSGQIQQSEDSVSASSPGDGDGLSRRKVAGPSARATGGTDRKVTRLRKGQEVKGIVKKLVSNGAFIELPEGESGFLRNSEIAEGGETVAVESLLTVGQEVIARVLRNETGKLKLTMKSRVDMRALNRSINNNEDRATSPFEIFFRNAGLINSEPTIPDTKVSMESTTVDLPAESEPLSLQTDEKTEKSEADPVVDTPMKLRAAN